MYLFICGLEISEVSDHKIRTVWFSFSGDCALQGACLYIILI